MASLRRLTKGVCTKVSVPAHTLIRIHRRTMGGPRVSLPVYAGVQSVGIQGLVYLHTRVYTGRESGVLVYTIYTWRIRLCGYSLYTTRCRLLSIRITSPAVSWSILYTIGTGDGIILPIIPAVSLGLPYIRPNSYTTLTLGFELGAAIYRFIWANIRRHCHSILLHNYLRRQ